MGRQNSEEAPRAGAGRQGVKAVGGGSLWQEDTPVRRGGRRGPGEEPALPAGGEGRRKSGGQGGG